MARTTEMVLRNSLTAVDGTQIPVNADTLCIHEDNEAAPKIAAAVHRALEQAGVDIKPPA